MQALKTEIEITCQAITQSHSSLRFIELFKSHLSS